MKFEIAATDLRTAISQFSQATGVQVVASPQVLTGRRSAGVRGTFTVREALSRLLRGTSLTMSVRGNLIVLTPGAAATATPAPRRLARAIPAADLTPEPQSAETPGADVPTDIIVSGYRRSLAEAQDLHRRGNQRGGARIIHR